MTRPLHLALALIALAGPASAQEYIQDARAAALVPSVLGRGDAGVALARRETAFFTNPAHVAATPGGFHLSLVGLAAGLNPTALDVGRRVYDEANGYSGNEEPCDTDGDGVPDDYCTGSGTSTEDTADELVRMARRPADLRGTILLPSVSFRAGSVGVSAGTFVQSTMRVQAAADAATGDSLLYTFMQTDGIGALTLSATLPAAVTAAVGKVTAGIGARYVRRFATTYDVDPGELDALGDPALVEGAAVSVDLGALWETPVDGLDAGLAVYDLGGTMDYVPSDFFGLLGEGGTTAEARRIERALEGRDGRRSFRVGAAYRPIVGPGVPEIVLLADYVSASTTAYTQPLLQHLRLGAEATLGGVLAARAGFGGGGPSVGATLTLVVLRLDYALYTRPSGRVEGADGGFQHALLVRLGLP